MINILTIRISSKLFKSFVPNFFLHIWKNYSKTVKYWYGSTYNFQKKYFGREPLSFPSQVWQESPFNLCNIPLRRYRLVSNSHNKVTPQLKIQFPIVPLILKLISSLNATASFCKFDSIAKFLVAVEKVLSQPKREDEGNQNINHIGFIEDME